MKEIFYNFQFYKLCQNSIHKSQSVFMIFWENKKNEIKRLCGLKNSQEEDSDIIVDYTQKNSKI